MSTNILILAAGQVAWENQAGDYPLCITEMDGISIIERIVNNTSSITDSHYCFAILKRDAERFHLDRVVSLLSPGCKVVRIPESTKGSACTALLAAVQLPPENDLLIISANELIDINVSDVILDFKRRQLDGGTLVFRSVHPRYSYVRLNDDGMAVEFAQQFQISKNATTGVFWFKKTEDFVESAKANIRKSAVVDGKFFVAPTFNEIILKQKRIGVFELELNKYHPLKTERQIQTFEQGI